RRDLIVLATGLVALQPLLTSIAGGVSPDAMLAALWAAATALAVRTVRHGLTPGRVIGLLALSAASALTHGRGVSLFAAALVAIGLTWWRTRPPARAVRIVGAVAGVGALAVAVAGLR